jgi:hypothetical protein
MQQPLQQKIHGSQGESNTSYAMSQPPILASTGRRTEKIPSAAGSRKQQNKRKQKSKPRGVQQNNFV